MDTFASSRSVRPDRPTSGPAVSVAGLRKLYRERQILDGVSFQVGAGEVFGLLGPNGAGMTTAVEIIQGLRGRDAGDVRILGHDPVQDRAALRGLVGSQLQSSALPDRMRVGEALRLFARLAGSVVDPHRLAEEWGLVGLRRSAFGALSGGERQRLFVALALVNDPRVVFLDELTQGLDPAARRDTWALIARLSEGDVAVVLVTHDMAEAELLCDRVAVLHQGQIRACGTPAALVAEVGGCVSTRFTVDDDTDLAGFDTLRGVHELRRDGRRVEITGDAGSFARVAGELARRDIAPADLVAQRPSLHDCSPH